MAASMRGGEKLAAFLAGMLRQAQTPRFVRVGFQNKLTYPANGSENPVFVAQVAFWNEYGTERTPPRPFFRTMIETKSPTWGRDVAKLAKYHHYDLDKVLHLMGERLVDQLRTSIYNDEGPANAASTIAKKGFDRPLIDSSIMVREGITYEVDE